MLAGADADTANRLLGTRMLRAIRGVQTRRRIHGRGKGGWLSSTRRNPSTVWISQLQARDDGSGLLFFFIFAR